MSFYGYVYNVIGTIGGAVTMPLWLPYVLARRKYRKSLISRLGFIPQSVRERLKEKPHIWVHAVSVGEVGIALTIMNALRPFYPHYNFVLSVTTLTGYSVAQKKITDEDILIFFPVEFMPVMDKVVSLVQPRIALIVETELWPNFIYALARRNIPGIVMNGRLSDTSFKRYKLSGPFIRDVLRNVSRFLMQTSADAERLVTLGAKKEHVRAVGNIKFDSVRVVEERVSDTALIDEIHMPHETPVFLAAALEKTGREDPLACDVFKALREKHPEAAMIIVPRHPERGTAVAECVKSYGWMPRRRSLKESFDDPASQIFILDTVGELTRFYTLARVVYVGKSMFPPGGGQNMIEPIALGIPTLYGKYTSNFRGIADQLAASGGARIAPTPDDLARQVCAVWNDETAASEMRKKGQAFICAQQGATDAHVEVVKNVLPPDTGESSERSEIE